MLVALLRQLAFWANVASRIVEISLKARQAVREQEVLEGVGAGGVGSGGVGDRLVVPSTDLPYREHLVSFGLARCGRSCETISRSAGPRSAATHG
jgi:hypothetical protein